MVFKSHNGHMAVSYKHPSITEQMLGIDELAVKVLQYTAVTTMAV
jgi:hypothetical protein